MLRSSAAALTEKKVRKAEEQLFFLPHGPCNRLASLTLHLFFSFTHSAHSYLGSKSFFLLLEAAGNVTADPARTLLAARIRGHAVL